MGLDLSFAMLNEAKKRREGVYLQGDALKLPFQAKSFDLVALITVLEFLPDSILALTEALRISRQGLILGVLNADSRLGRQYKRDGGPIWEAARFLTPVKLEEVILNITGKKQGFSGAPHYGHIGRVRCHYRTEDSLVWR